MPKKDTPTTPEPGSGTLTDIETKISGLLGGAAAPQPTDDPEPADDTPEGEPDATPTDGGDAPDGDDAPDVEDVDLDAVDDDADDGEPEDDEPAKYDVVVDGKIIERVTAEDAVRGYMRQADYSRKTQAAAEARKAAEAAKSDAVAKAQTYAERLKKLDETFESIQPKEPDWEKVKAERPDEYPQEFADWQRAQRRRDQLKAERGRVEQQLAQEHQQQFARYLEQEVTQLREALPDFRDPEKGKALQAKIVEYGVRQGFPEEAIAGLADHRAVVVLNKARLYDAIMARKAKIGKRANAPTATPGARGRKRPAGAEGKDKARAKLSESHHFEDGVAAIQGLFESVSK